MESIRPTLSDAPIQWVRPLSAIIEDVLYHFTPARLGVMVSTKSLSCIEHTGSFTVDDPTPCFEMHTTNTTQAFLPYQGLVPSQSALQQSQEGIGYLWQHALGARAHRIVEACRLLILLAAEPFSAPGSVIKAFVFARSQQVFAEHGSMRQELPLNVRPLYALTKTCLVYTHEHFQPPNTFWIDRPKISAHQRLEYHRRLETLLASEPWDATALLASLKA